MYYKANYNSKIGILTLVFDEKNLVGLQIYGQKSFNIPMEAKVVEEDNFAIFKYTKDWLDSYFNHEKPQIADLPLAPAGSDFRQRVWQILREIPYGEVTTYGEIAKIIAKETGKEKMSAQAIGGAVGHNPISIIIPCHRVIGVNGNLTGYSGGINLKIKLLEHEAVDMSRFSINKN